MNANRIHMVWMLSDVNCTSLLIVWHLCNLPCRAYTLFRLVSTSCKICFKAQSIGSKGTKIDVFCGNNAYFDSLLAYIATPRPDITASTVCCFLIKNIIFILVQVFYRDCRSFTSRKLYVFREALLCLLHQFGRAKEKQQVVRDEIELLDVHSWNMTDFP